MFLGTAMKNCLLASLLDLWYLIWKWNQIGCSKSLISSEVRAPLFSSRSPEFKYLIRLTNLSIFCETLPLKMVEFPNFFLLHIKRLLTQFFWEILVLYLLLHNTRYKFNMKLSREQREMLHTQLFLKKIEKLSVPN